LGKIAQMRFKTFNERTQAPDVASAPLTVRPIADHSLWSLSEYVCSAGPHDRPFEERHDRVSLALVASGTFRYRTDSGEGLLYPGALLLGNAGAGYECGHEHSHGDRCLALHIDRDLYAEIASGVSGLSDHAFRRATLPAAPGLAAIAVALQNPNPSRLALEETVLDFVAAVAGVAAANHAPARRPSAAAMRRIPRVVDYIESHLLLDLDLATLSQQATMSRYHFLRTFKRATGLTPHQYVLGRRLRLAAARIRSSAEPIAHVAAAAGFGDLSTFNHLFRSAIGVTPTTFRSGRRKPAWRGARGSALSSR
jgi:AraC family transcriptional regulator